MNIRRQGQKYADEEAAEDIYRTALKQPLVSDKSPFLVLFEYGENKEGYWNYNKMVLQLEDAVDVLQVMHPDFDYVFLFDHSSGHSKQRPDGLNVSRMNGGYGGKNAPLMRPTQITDEQGCLGIHPRILSKDSWQHLNWDQETDIGPFEMTPEEREQNRYDIVLETFTERDRNRAELENDLIQKGINTSKKSKKELSVLCVEHCIPVKHKVYTVRPGWKGKPKGMRQVLWERGLIDATKLSTYTNDGKKDQMGIIDKSKSLWCILGQCTDFINEQGMMQYIGRQLGVTVLLTPKCHAELAGEGIEYAWGCSKGAYRNLALKEKRGKAKFMSSVRYCLSDEVLSLQRIRKFARRAKQYLMAYHVIDSKQVDQQTQDDCNKYGPIALGKVIKDLKCHRSAVDVDYKFIKCVLNEAA